MDWTPCSLAEVQGLSKAPLHPASGPKSELSRNYPEGIELAVNMELPKTSVDVNIIRRTLLNLNFHLQR